MTSSASDDVVDATGNTTAYVLSSVSVDAAAVDVDGGTATVTLTVVTDDVRDPVYIDWFWLDPDGETMEAESNDAYYSDAGLHVTIYFYKGAKPGLYKLSYISADEGSFSSSAGVLYCSSTNDCDDIDSYHACCYPENYEVIFTDLSAGDITVTSSAPDATAPVLSSVFCDTTAVDVDGGAATVAFTGVVSDESPQGEMTCRWSTPGDPRTHIDTHHIHSDIPDVDAALESELTFFPGSVPGLYQLCVCYTSDVHGNGMDYYRPNPTGCSFEDEEDHTFMNLSACDVRCPGFLRTCLMCKTR